MPALEHLVLLSTIRLNRWFRRVRKVRSILPGYAGASHGCCLSLTHRRIDTCTPPGLHCSLRFHRATVTRVPLQFCAAPNTKVLATVPMHCMWNFPQMTVLSRGHQEQELELPKAPSSSTNLPMQAGITPPDLLSPLSSSKLRKHNAVV